MVLDQFNYNPGKNKDRRRQVLKKAIRSTNYDAVYNSLQRKIESLEGYKVDRAEWDLSWLKKNSNKYYTTLNGSK
jgi:hypothetical protein